MRFLGYYLAVINFTTWVIYGLDKGRARSGKAADSGEDAASPDSGRRLPGRPGGYAYVPA